MIKRIFTKLGDSFLTLFGVAVVVFFLFHLLPGDPVGLMVPPGANNETRETIRKQLGLDKPLHVQLLMYLNDVSPLGIHPDTPEARQEYRYRSLFQIWDNQVVAVKLPYLRRSFQSNKRVTEILADSLVGTAILALAAMLIATVLGITLGVIAAYYQGTYIDHSLIFVSVLGISIPSFVSAILIGVLFGHILGDYTGLSITGYLWENDPLEGKVLVLKNLILPAITLGIRPLAIIMQLTRSSMIEVSSQDYIRTARAKGVGKLALVFSHELKNALNPVVTAISGWLASLLAGAFFVEYIFTWKGLGLKTIYAVNTLDLPVIMGTAILIAGMFVVIHIVVDVVYAIIDPRIRVE